MSFWGELKRRNVFKVAVAYLVASWLIVQIVGVLTEPLDLPDVLDTVVVVLLAIGFPFALIAAWIYDVTPEGIKVTAPEDGVASTSGTSGKRLTYVVIVLFVLAVGLMAVNRLAREPPPDGFGAGSRLAILPCTDLSPDPSNAFFATGIHQELVRQLSSFSGIDVISPSSVQQYAGGQTPAPQVAEELDVQAVLECSALYSGDQVRLTTLLVDGLTAASLWSSVYPGDMSNLSEIFQIQADIAMNVANALAVEFSLDEQRALARTLTDQPEAYTLYLRARSISGDAALELLEDALRIDPNFALAHVELAKRHMSAVVNTAARNAVSEEERETRIRLASEHARRAVELDPLLTTSYATLGQLLAYQWEWTAAKQALEQAESTFDDPVTTWLFSYMGDHETAIRLGRRAVELDPAGSEVRLALALAYADEHTEALEMLGESIRREPTSSFSRVWRAVILTAADREAEALDEIRVAEQLMQDAQAFVFLPEIAYVYSRLGQMEDAMRLVAQLQSRVGDRDIGTGAWALAWLAVGENERAIEQLETATRKVERNEIDQGFFNLMNIKMNFANDPLLEQTPFLELRSRLAGN